MGRVREYHSRQPRKSPHRRQAGDGGRRGDFRQRLHDVGNQPEPVKSSRVNPTIGGFRQPPHSRHGDHTGGYSINTQVLHARITESRSVWIAALVPVALSSMLLVVAMFGYAAVRRRLDDLTLLAATVTFALLGNALICGVISGPHDRYGARVAWIATLTVLISAARYFGDEDEPDDLSLSP